MLHEFGLLLKLQAALFCHDTEGDTPQASPRRFPKVQLPEFNVRLTIVAIVIGAVVVAGLIASVILPTY